ncbi:MAG: PQQ-dependent sugar dehydrogenase [Bacteroidota bacterium]
MRIRNAFLLIGYLFLSPYILLGQLPDNFKIESVSSRWFSVTGIAFDEAGHLFGWSKFGQVYLAKEDYTQPELLLDISEEVASFGDLGLLGFTLHPNFLENGYIYLLYMVDPHYFHAYGTSSYNPQESWTHRATIGRITRYTVDIEGEIWEVSPNSRKVLLGEQGGLPGEAFAMLFDSHGVGSLVFGADGSLLVSCGDGASYKGIDAGAYGEDTESYREEALATGVIRPDQDIGTFRSQYLHSANGKVLRIDSETGAGLPSNPFYDPKQPYSTISKVWAMGFRNPFRFSLMPGTGAHNPAEGNPGTFILGEVGWAWWEELNVLDGGGKNFGWPMYGGMIGRWQFSRWASPTPNLRVPNPLASCDKPYLLFQDLLSDPLKSGAPTFPNPCAPEIGLADSIPFFIHQRPIISWSNQDHNPEEQGTHVPGFDSVGNAAIIRFGEPENPVKGESFTGTCSIGGTFYTGNNFPAEYQMVYFHADYSGWIRQFIFGPNNELLEVKPFADTTKNIVSMAVNPRDGALYYIRYGFWSTLNKIQYGGNSTPQAKIVMDRIYGSSPLKVRFDGSTSVDPDGDSLTYKWDFGNFSLQGSPTPTHVFRSESDRPQSFPVKLTVSDGKGGKHTTQSFVSVNNTPPEVKIGGLPDSALYGRSEVNIFDLQAEVVDAEHPSESLRYEWQSFLHHNTHFHPEPVEESREKSFSFLPLGCEDEIYYYRVRLTVTDPAGLQGIDEREIYPDCGPSAAAFGEIQSIYREDGLELRWNTLFENRCKQLEIYEVNGLGETTKIGTLAGGGTLPEGKTYAFVHLGAKIGENIYFFRAVNDFGSYVEEEASFMYLPLNTSFRLYPNPGTDELQLLVWRFGGRVNLRLFDLTGREVLAYSYFPTQIRPQQISTQGLPIGIYTYIMDNGLEQVKGRWMKQ